MPALNIIPIERLDDPRVADYANLPDRALSLDRGRFIAEGEFVVRRLIESTFRTRSVFLTPHWLERTRDALARLEPQTPVYLAPDVVLDAVVGFKFHRGVLACGESGPARRAEEVIFGSRLLVVLEDLANLDNVGSIFRITAGLAGPGAGVLLSPACCDPLYRKTIRTSMGHALRVPFARVASWPDGLEVAREAGFTIVALTPSPGAVPVRRLGALRGRPVALLFGAEGPGLSPAALRAADLHAQVPMAAGADSLNVGVAAAIVLHELCAEA